MSSIHISTLKAAAMTCYLRPHFATELIRFLETVAPSENPFCIDERTSSSTTAEYIEGVKQSRYDRMVALVTSLRESLSGDPVAMHAYRSINPSALHNIIRCVLVDIPNIIMANNEYVDFFNILKIKSAVEGKSKESIRQRRIEKDKFNARVGSSLRSIAAVRIEWIKKVAADKTRATIPQRITGVHKIDFATGNNKKRRRCDSSTARNDDEEEDEEEEEVEDDEEEEEEEDDEEDEEDDEEDEEDDEEDEEDDEEDEEDDEEDEEEDEEEDWDGEAIMSFVQSLIASSSNALENERTNLQRHRLQLELENERAKVCRLRLQLELENEKTKIQQLRLEKLKQTKRSNVDR